MPKGRAVWLGILTAATGYEIHGILADTKEDTLSEFIRWAFHVDTPVGAGLFVIFIVGLAGWLLPHILNGAKKSSGSE